MSEVKVNKISPRTACGTVTVGDSGDAVCVSAGVPVTVQGDLKSPALKATDGGVIISQSGTDITIGASGDTIALACGASQTGFGREGSVNWATAIKTTDFTAVSGEGYFCNTTSGAITVTFPAASVGSIISIADYAGTFGNPDKELIISPDGTDKIGGVSGKTILSTDNQSITFVYADTTKGWFVVQDSTETVTGGALVVASGGNITTDGDYKIHTFTGPGTFGVIQLSPSAPENVVDWTVIGGGGGGGGSDGGGGGGAGGYRESPGAATGCYTVSPLAGGSTVPVTITDFPITIGAGGTGAPAPGGGAVVGTNGGASSFSIYPSAGGGYGGTEAGSDRDGNTGGSGGGGNSGGGGFGCGAAGNTPPTSPAQGTAGGNAYGTSPPVHRTGGGGGGATAAGANAGDGCGGNGGTGATSSIDGTPTERSGGGGGGTGGATGGTATGGGGKGGNYPAAPAANSAEAGTDNTGGGAGGQAGGVCGGVNGGSGVVLIRYKYQ